MPRRVRITALSFSLSSTGGRRFGSFGRTTRLFAIGCGIFNIPMRSASARAVYSSVPMCRTVLAASGLPVGNSFVDLATRIFESWIAC